MRYLFLAILAAASTAHAQSSTNNTTFVRQPIYVDVPASIVRGSDFALGSGVDMRTPHAPLGANIPAFPDLPSKDVPVRLDDHVASVGNETNIPTGEPGLHCTLREFESSLDEYQTLEANGGLSLYGVEVKASAETFRRHREDHQSVYAFCEVQSATVPVKTDRVLSLIPRSDTGKYASDDERLRQFLDDYGSHYITSVTRRGMIIVVGEHGKMSNVEREKYRASFNAVFDGGKGDGSGMKEHVKRLAQQSTMVQASVVNGVLLDATTHEMKVTAYTSLADAAELFDGLRKGALRLKPSVAMITLKSFAHTLKPDSPTRRILTTEPPNVPSTLYGVPRGTIIAWRPDPATDYRCETDESGRVIKEADGRCRVQKNLHDALKVPDGWAICDSVPSPSATGVPDLVGRFLMGGSGPGETYGGSDKHHHTGKTTSADGNTFDFPPKLSTGRLGSQKGHTHEVETSDTTTLPPYYTVVYLIRL